MKRRLSTDICSKCGRSRKQAGVLIPFKDGYICDKCVEERNRRIMADLKEDQKLEAIDAENALDPNEEAGSAVNGEDEEGEDETPFYTPIAPLDFERIDKLLKEHKDVPTIEDLSSEKIDPDAVSLVPRAVAEQFCLIPIRKVGKQLIVAFSDPSDEEAIKEVKYFTNLDIDIQAADAFDIEDAIEKYYAAE